MRIKRPPPPPQPPASQPPSYTGPRTLGAQQAAYLERLRRARQWQQKSGKVAGKRKSTGMDASELVTEFDQAMDEAYDRILGRQGRHHQGQDADDDQPPEPPKAGARELPAAFRVVQARLKG